MEVTFQPEKANAIIEQFIDREVNHMAILAQLAR
jgi:hypothetical protein